jgi:hypothetical protein
MRQLIWWHHSHWTLKSPVPTEYPSFVHGSPAVHSWWRFDKIWTLVAEMKCEIEEPSTEAARHPDWIKKFHCTFSPSGSWEKPRCLGSTWIPMDLTSFAQGTTLPLRGHWMTLFPSCSNSIHLWLPWAILSHRRAYPWVHFWGRRGKSPVFYQPTWDSLKCCGMRTFSWSWIEALMSSNRMGLWFLELGPVTTCL